MRVRKKVAMWWGCLTILATTTGSAAFDFVHRWPKTTVTADLSPLTVLPTVFFIIKGSPLLTSLFYVAALATIGLVLKWFGDQLSEQQTRPHRQ